jgi:FlaA1/EpsC-like NDP-sugar epimerase
VTPCVADGGDVVRLGEVFAAFLPDVVFHPVAHQQASVLEWDPAEAVKSNVVGTRNLADLADAHGVAEFVLVSTDKAVNPTSVLGASGRVAERHVQALSRRSRTRYVVVRAGRWLGSAGSLLPLLQEQIARGGPVTLSHPELRRSFLTAAEGCRLVLQAAAMGNGGEVFLLGGGEPVKVADLARDLIRLAGLRPGTDVEVRFTGLRPGEGLDEGPALPGEAAGQTGHPHVFLARRADPGTRESVNQHIEELRELADGADPHAVRAKFQEVVPEYRYEARPSTPHGRPSGGSA